MSCNCKCALPGHHARTCHLYVATPKSVQATGSAWPCVSCSAANWEDAGEKCKGGYVCSADEQRMRDHQASEATPNDKLCNAKERQ